MAKPNQFSLDVARVLKAYFAELGTQREMDGADTVEALGSIYDLAKRGVLLKGAPKLCAKCGGKIPTETYMQYGDGSLRHLVCPAPKGSVRK